VAAGLPTVHYNWLIHCCQQRCLLPHSLYLLPAGYSVEKGSDVFMYVSSFQLLNIFNDINIYMYVIRNEC
jgi:hypothetical protein